MTEEDMDTEVEGIVNRYTEIIGIKDREEDDSHTEVDGAKVMIGYPVLKKQKTKGVIRLQIQYR